MSWDVVLFNSKQKIESIEKLDEESLEPIDFCGILESYFENIIKDDNHREIKGKNFAIDYFIDDEPVSNKMLSLYGENGLYELIILAKKYDWQIFDTGMGEMVDLDNPEKNGYVGFMTYLNQVTKNH